MFITKKGFVATICVCGGGGGQGRTQYEHCVTVPGKGQDGMEVRMELMVEVRVESKDGSKGKDGSKYK